MGRIFLSEMGMERVDFDVLVFGVLHDDFGTIPVIKDNNKLVKNWG